MRDKKLRIAVIAPARPSEYFDLVWQGIWSAACELSPFGVNVEPFETDGHDILAQRQILADLMGSFEDSLPAAIALIPAHSQALNSEVDHFVALGIPVITFNVDAPACGRSTYVGTDASQSGALAGELLAKMMRGLGTVISFPGSLETEHLAQRYLAFRKELKCRAPGIQESVYHSGLTGLADAAKFAFNSGAKIDGIYVGCSQSYLIAEAMERSGILVPCIGFDDTPATHPYLKRGTFSAVIDESPYQQGYLAVQQAYEAVSGLQKDGLRKERISWVRIPSGVLFSANTHAAGGAEVYMGVFEVMMRRRTQKVVLCEELLDEANARLVSMGHTDSLTGLLNRERFEEILHLRSQDQEKLALLIIGMNGIARTFAGSGSQVTDEALINLAKVLRAHSRPDDYCARLSGDEFGILMPGADPKEAGEVRRRILADLDHVLIAPKTLKLHLRTSIGLASMPSDAQNAEDLLVLADNAMYAHRRSSFIRTRITI